MTDRIVSVDTSGAMQALKTSRRVLVFADGGLRQGATLIRRDAVRLAPKAEGDLQRNIQSGRLAFLVHEIISRSKHSRFVEEGTGIYGPKGRRIGNRMLPDAGVARIAQWIKRKGIRARTVPQAQLPWIIAAKLARDGAAASPHMEPAEVVNRPRVQQLVLASIERGIAALGLNRVSA